MKELGLRPVLVRRRDGEWQVLDFGRKQRDWDGQPRALWPTCCFQRAVFVADRVADKYRLRVPDYVVAPGLPHPPHSGAGTPCEKAPAVKL